MHTVRSTLMLIALSASLAIIPATSQAGFLDRGHADAAANELPAGEFLDMLLSKEVMSRGKKTKTKMSFSIDEAGPLQLKLEELDLYDDIKKLKAKVISDGKVIGKMKGAGLLEFDAVPGEYLLKIKSKVGKKMEGMFYAEVASLSDNNLPAAVPLPPAIWLFGSALAVLGGLSRRKGKA